MFKHKNLLISLAVATLLAACGGGGSSTPATASTGAGATSQPASGGGGTTTPTPTPTTVAVDNTAMSGDLLMASSQVVVNGNLIPLDAFTTTANGAYGFAQGTNAPLTSFGLRIKPENMNLSGAQSKTVRLAIELLDKATGGTTQKLQMMIDKVNIDVSATNDLTITVPADAKIYAYAMNGSGTGNATVTTAPANLITMTTVPGDTTSQEMQLNLDAAVAAAQAAATDAAGQAAFAAVKDYTNPTTLNLTISNVALKTDANPQVTLSGKDISVTNSGQPSILGGDATAVSGGVSGTICQSCNAPG